MNLNNLSNYEKGSLVIFGTADASTTVTNLADVALQTVHDEDEMKLSRLIDKIFDLSFNKDYVRYFYNNAEEMDRRSTQSVLGYQNFTGDLETGKPWKNYLRAQLVDAFCCDDPDFSRYRLHKIAAVSVNSDFQNCVQDLTETIAAFPPTKEGIARYQKFRTMNEDIVRTARDKKRRGKDVYRQYVWNVPEIRIFDV